MSDARTRLREIYRAEQIPEFLESAAVQLEAFYERASRGHNFDWKPAEAMLEFVQQWTNSPGQPAREIIQAYLQNSRHLPSPKYMGHQVPPPLPFSSVMDGLGSMTNQGGAVYEMSPFATCAERDVTERLIGKIGWSYPASDGIGVHGGSIANLTALLVARNRRYPNITRQGFSPEACRGAVITSRDSHYSISRAASLLGIGSERVIKADVDEKRRLTVATVQDAIRRAQAQGLEVFCVVLVAGSTPVGAYDPIAEIVDYAHQEKLWLHVDGAHGASALFSPSHRSKLVGIEHADSVTWDAHKMLFSPSLSTFLLFRQAEMSFLGFEQDAPYLFGTREWTRARFNIGLRTLECTRRSMALGVWGALALYGEDIFRDLVDVTYENAQRFHELLKEQPDFRSLHEPESNILCFQYAPPELAAQGTEAVSAVQSRLRGELLELGEHYITETRLDGEGVLRVTLINPLTTERDLLDLIREIRDRGRNLVD